MDTTRNLAKVFAIALRASSSDLRTCTGYIHAAAVKARWRDALDSIDAVADELETYALTPPAPDPAGEAANITRR